MIKKDGTYKILLLLTIILQFPFIVQASPAETLMAEQVLSQLYYHHQNYTQEIPKIRIRNNDELIALYLQPSNTIELSHKTIEICKSMGQDSLDALAFIIGHELAHSFIDNKDNPIIQFLANPNNLNTTLKQIEEQADVLGLYMAYQAGFYNSIGIADRLVDQIYHSFQLDDEILGYPTLQERKAITSKVVAITNELIQLYHIGNHLLVIEKFQLAIDCFKFIEKWDKSTETYNNIGLVYTLLALNFSKKNSTKFIFPLELNWSARIKKPNVKRGTDLNKEAEDLKKGYVKEAMDYFSKAEKLSKNCTHSAINVICLLLIEEKHTAALEYYNCHVQCRTAENELRFEMVEALIYQTNNQSALAKNILEGLIKKAPNTVIGTQAATNLSILNEEVISISEIICPEISGTFEIIDEVKLHRIQPSLPYKTIGDHQTKYSLEAKENSIVCFFENNGSSFVVQLMNTLNSNQKLLPNSQFNNLFTNQGSIVHCPNTQISYLLNSDGKILEWLKY